MTVRVYVPTTSSALAVIVAERVVPGPLQAHAVTDELRAGWAEGDEDAWEYAALGAAADHSADLRGPEDRPRRYVVAADVRAVDPVAGDDPTLVRVAGDIAWAAIASAHADIADDAAEDDDLAWFARQEIPDLV